MSCLFTLCSRLLVKALGLEAAHLPRGAESGVSLAASSLCGSWNRLGRVEP